MTTGKNREDGFTLVEVMLASALSLLIFLVMFETMLFARRVAEENKLRLSADALAYDLTMNLFNRELTGWFEKLPVQGTWTNTGLIRPATDNVWLDDVTYVCTVQPNGVPSTNWTIRTSVQWSDAMGVVRSFSSEQYVVNRQRCNR